MKGHAALVKYCNSFSGRTMFTKIWRNLNDSEYAMITKLRDFEKRSLREKCPNAEFFLVRIFPHSDQKKLRIWALFRQCLLPELIIFSGVAMSLFILAPSWCQAKKQNVFKKRLTLFLVHCQQYIDTNKLGKYAFEFSLPTNRKI